MNDLDGQKFSALLQQDTLTDEERKQLLYHLENSDGTALQQVMKVAFESGDTSTLSPDTSRTLLKNIHKQLNLKEDHRQTPTIRKWISMVAVAASLVLLFALVWQFLSKTHSSSTHTQHTTESTSDVAVVSTVHEVNATGKDRQLRLPDSSLLILFNNSEVTYHVPFTTQRDITLNGKAYFKVAKDKTRPFSVRSGPVTTTALGTEFQVTAYQNTGNLNVRLYEGKVVIKAVDKKDWRMKNDFYLLPGQMFIYKVNVLAKVKNFGKQPANDDLEVKNESSADQPLIPEGNSADWYMFNNESLGSVLDDLAAFYNTKIIYDKKDVRKVYFIGKYNKTDSLEEILQRIGTLNNLQITKNDTAYFITRK